MSDFWRIMDSCVCGYIDHSPRVNPPYCMIKGEDYDCDQCVVTEEEKNKAIEEYEELAEKQEQERIEKEKERQKQIRKQIRIHNAKAKIAKAETKRKSDEFERKCFAGAVGKEKQIKEMAEVLSTHFQSELDLTNDISEMAISLFEAGYRKQSETVKEFAEKIMDKNCRNCEHAFLETCKGCNTLPPNNTYENFELRKDITAEKHRADVAEEALRLACNDVRHNYYMTGTEALIDNYKQQAVQRLKEKKE